MESLPVRGAWIEISPSAYNYAYIPSLPVRGAWIEISSWRAMWNMLMSLPVRGAWIEMISPGTARGTEFVAPRAGSVD